MRLHYIQSNAKLPEFDEIGIRQLAKDFNRPQTSQTVAYFYLPYIPVYKSIRILRQEIASLKVLPVYKSTPQFKNILE